MRCSRSFLISTLVASAICLGVTSIVAGQATKQRSSAVFCLCAGFIGGGEVTVKESFYKARFDLEQGGSGGIGIEFASSHFLTVALTADIHQINPEDMDGKTMLDVGLAIKRAAKRNGRVMMVRPWAGLSYGHVPEFGSWVEASNYLVVKGGLEVDLFPQGGRTGMFFDFGLLAAPVSKAGDADVSPSTRSLVRFGLVFR